MKPFLLAVLIAVTTAVSAQTITNETTAKLIESGDGPFVAIPAGATEPDEPRVPALTVTTPNGQTSRMLNLVNPSIAIPYNSPIRQLQAFWNGTPLKLIDPAGSGIVEEAHSYGSMIPFFKPLFSLAGLPSGSGTLEIHGLDANGAEVATVAIPDLFIAAAPQAVATSTIVAMPHPRIYLTAARMAAIRARPANDVARQRYEAALAQFLDALTQFPDVTSPQFEDAVYDPESYIPLLALAYQLHRNDDPQAATRAAGAAHTLTMRIANDYNSGARDFGRDTGYDIRFGLRNLMLAYDWMYDQFTPAERALIVSVATRWVDWYHKTPGYAESWPIENYYAGYVQGIALTAVATAGDNPDADRILGLLRFKLANEMPVMNQRLAGGDWAEGWNYGWYSVTELTLLNQLLRDLGEDWGADFDWLASLPLSLSLQVAPDYSETRPYGGYSGDYPHRTSPATLAALSGSSGVIGFFAHSIYVKMNAKPHNDFADQPGDRFYEMNFDTQGVPPPIAFFLSVFNSGTGRFFSRSSLNDPDAYFVSTENISYSYDHYGYANGDVRLYHGNGCIVCPSAYGGPQFDGEAVTPAFSTYVVNGQPQSVGRNNQNFFHIDQATYSAIGMRFESSWPVSRYDEDIVSPDNPLDYMIREVVHLRPGTLIVRDLHRRRHASDTLAGYFHLDEPVLGFYKVSTLYPHDVTVSYGYDVDRGGNRIGMLMRLTFASSTAPMELVTVISETLSATSYAGGTLTLSDGTRVLFANNTVTVTSAPPSRHRGAKH
ncbi:MAG TPA: hypothetical protein VHU41_16585 [Thermoanaerobaculia bacterium]|nr:hypothetical protein [Thermoanaerobaculia bacterium]